MRWYRIGDLGKYVRRVNLTTPTVPANWVILNPTTSSSQTLSASASNLDLSKLMVPATTMIGPVQISRDIAPIEGVPQMMIFTPSSGHYVGWTIQK